MEFELHWHGAEIEDLRIVTAGKVTAERLDAMVCAAVSDPRFRLG